MNRLIISCVCAALFAMELSRADTISIGPDGINASSLPFLTGSGVNIGEVELVRPGKPDFDVLHNDLVNPDFVYYRDDMTANNPIRQDVGDGLHALQVAGVMIAEHSTEEDEEDVHGVSPGAILHASAFDPAGPFYLGTGSATVLLTTQRIATISNMRAINMSFNLGLFSEGEPNGKQPITAFVDWSARVHNVLYVVAGTERLDGIFNGETAPSDNYNGITVAASMRPTVNSKFSQVWSENYFGEDADAVGRRTSTDLLAPGDNIQLTSFNNNNTLVASGTSLAAPHVTGTVALLQQFATSKIPSTGWNTVSPRRHEVMKAVLMNSADKIEDDGSFFDQGTVLGMERTVVKQDGSSTWLDSFAYNDGFEETGVFDPLDDEMGAGHLNAKRAYQQFLPGEYNAGEDVPSIGWDYGMTAGVNDPDEGNNLNRYDLTEELQLGDFISITLAWDRVSELFTPGDTVYNAGDAFKGYVEEDANDVINDLDVYLIPRDDPLNQYVAASTNLEYTVEHIFFQIPETGFYDIVVRQADQDVGTGQSYGLAWWYGLAPPIEQPNVTGDFNGDSRVDGKDFLAWQRGQSPDPLSAGDLADWQGNYGAGAVSAATAVPEPSCLMLVFGLVLLQRNRR